MREPYSARSKVVSWSHYAETAMSSSHHLCALFFYIVLQYSVCYTCVLTLEGTFTLVPMHKQGCTLVSEMKILV